MKVGNGSHIVNMIVFDFYRDGETFFHYQLDSTSSSSACMYTIQHECDSYVNNK